MGNLIWAVRELNSEGRVGVKKRKREGMMWEQEKRRI